MAGASAAKNSTAATHTEREEEEINKMQQIGQYFLMIISLDATGQGSQSAD